MKQAQISYKVLRKINPEAARTAILQYAASVNNNISLTASFFGVTRLTVYDILEKSKVGDLNDRHKAPKKVANKTLNRVILKIIGARKRYGFGAKRLSDYLLKQNKIKISPGTVKGILKREKNF